MKKTKEGFGLKGHFIFIFIFIIVLSSCICIGSVQITFSEILRVFFGILTGNVYAEETNILIVLSVRLPRVLSVALIGSALSICGVVMQGLLQNPLADGSTLGVSSGASLGAVISIVSGFKIPGFSYTTMVIAIIFAFLSLIFILTFAQKVDNSMSTNTIILVGVIFSMFTNSIISLLTTFAGEKVKTITFWTMGSLAGSGYPNVLVMLVSSIFSYAIIAKYLRELNAISVNENNAKHIGVDTKKIKLILLIIVAILIGVCTSIGGTIGFVGLIIPHITRMITGPNHKKLIPAVLYFGAIFLMLADLISRIIFTPKELPIGVVTSLIGSCVFVYIFYSKRKAY